MSLYLHGKREGGDFWLVGEEEMEETAKKKWRGQVTHCVSLHTSAEAIETPLLYAT